MSDIKIDSSESEGAFNEYIEEHLNDIVDKIIKEGDLSDRGSEIIVDMDEMKPPSFVYGDQGGGGQGAGNQGPGGDSGKITFSMPFDRLMEAIAKRLKLPQLIKEGQGRIKEVSFEFKTFGTAGIILDKKRTFRRALRSSVGMGSYDPENGKYDVQVRRRDKRFKLPERVEKPRYKAVVFYMGDISYSTMGERLEMEKRIVNFIHLWLDYNYGKNNVDHRFFVHDSTAYEVLPEDFYKVSNAGGTMAAGVFDLVYQIAYNEYDPQSTNFYAFYFGDGELFESDANEIVQILEKDMKPIFNRVGIVEVKPSHYSFLRKIVVQRFGHDAVVKVGELKNNDAMLDVIKILFSDTSTESKAGVS